MNKRPGHVVVTTEVGFCSFCGRPRTLRSEAHQLGTLVRTIVTCETCHRTLSSTIGVATNTEKAEAEPAPTATEAEPAEPEVAPAKPAAKRKPVAAESPASKTRTTKKAK
jgi:hypothetical protein